MIQHIFKLIWNKRGSNALMILEIFLSFLVLFAVVAYMQFNLGRKNIPMGFETQDKWAIFLDGFNAMDSLEAANKLTTLKRDLIDQEEIESVSFGNWAFPFSGSNSSNENDSNGFDMYAVLINADIDLKRTMELNIVEGRWFIEDDFNSTVPCVVVNSKFMELYYPKKSMIDSTFLFPEPLRIVGVVDHYRYQGQFEEDESTIIYLEQFTDNQDVVMLNMKKGVSASYEENLSQVVKTSIKSSSSVLANFEKMRIENSRDQWLMMGALFFVSIFLCLNVALGLFGVLWYSINKRKSEIGLRQALGANGFQITTQFVMEIMILTTIALVAGIFFAIQIPLLDVTEYPDQLFYKSILYSSLIILTLVFICALFPSIQAAKIRPAQSLHED